MAEHGGDGRAVAVVAAVRKLIMVARSGSLPCLPIPTFDVCGRCWTVLGMPQLMYNKKFPVLYESLTTMSPFVYLQRNMKL